MIQEPSLAALPSIRHGFFTRVGGVSEGGYASLNCGLASGDDRTRISINRARAVAQLGLPADRLAALQQVHGHHAILIDESWRSGHWPVADGMVTSQKRIALGILGADCPPVLFADARAGIIGAAHAGWRGALAGITDSVIDLMLTQGARLADITAVIGPGIGVDSYEVSADFRQQFLAEKLENEAFFRAGKRDLHWQFDLPAYISARLTARAIGRVIAMDHDTLADAVNFFSHRRAQLAGEAQCGRQLSAIALEAK